MAHHITAALGGSVPLVLRSREIRSDSLDGQLFALIGAWVESIKKTDGTAFSPLPSFKYKSDGVLVAYWDTSGLTDSDAGDYWVTIAATPNMGGQPLKKRFLYRLVKQQGAS